MFHLFQLALTHPSHHLNFGMNPDHARNSLSNCGIRQPKYGDRKVHHMYMRKKGLYLKCFPTVKMTSRFYQATLTLPSRGFLQFFFAGINTLINIMSRLGQDDPSPSR